MKKSLYVIALYIIGLCVWFTGSPFAQREKFETLRERGRLKREEKRLEREKIREMIEDLRIVRMTKEVGLSDEQLAKLLPKIREVQESQRGFHRKRMDIIRDLNEMIETGAKSGEIQAKLTELEKLENENETRGKEVRKSVKGILSIEQQAKFIVFNERFEREIQEMIKAIRGGPKPGPGGPPPEP